MFTTLIFVPVKGSLLKHVTPGFLFWITGLAGAGKTTVGETVAELLRERHKNVIFLDGDELRKIFNETNADCSYSESARLSMAYRYSRLCAHLTGQGHNVVCATMSLFPEIWRWNRSHISNYFEVYVEVPFPVLVKRNKKGLYSDVHPVQGATNVVGVDILFHQPENPDFRIINDGSETPHSVAQKILESWSSTQ